MHLRDLILFGKGSKGVYGTENQLLLFNPALLFCRTHILSLGMAVLFEIFFLSQLYLPPRDAQDQDFLDLSISTLGQENMSCFLISHQYVLHNIYSMNRWVNWAALVILTTDNLPDYSHISEKEKSETQTQYAENDNLYLGVCTLQW